MALAQGLGIMREPNGNYPNDREGCIPRSFMHRAF
jgi:hypothetical protein